MAGLHLVTGYKGTAHITSADQGVLNAYTVGTGEYVLTKGKMFEAQIINNNTVRIYDGCLMMNGRQVNLDAGSYLDAVITNGTQGMNRHDIIAIRYERNNTTGVESASLVVGVGTPSNGTPTDAENKYTNSILNGVTVHDMPLYRVILSGLNITRVEPLFQVLAPMADMQRGFNRNLLINGDFQCNQRKKDAYDTRSQVQYTVDMWRAYQVIVAVHGGDNGVTITGNTTAQGYFTQFIQLGELKTTTYTISAMVDDKLCTFTVTPGGTAKEKDFGTFKISALTTSAWDYDLNGYNNKLKINVCPVGDNSIHIKYIDVFEGTVAFPHVVEDAATALMRCRRYIQRGSCYAPILRRTFINEGGDAQYRFAISFDPMASLPTLVACSWNYYAYTNNAEEGDKDDLTVATTILDGRMDLITPKRAYKDEYCHCVSATYVLSCEHNPNGD